MRALGSLILWAADEARVPRRHARSRSIATCSRAPCRAPRGASAHHDRAWRDHDHSLAVGDRDGSAHLRCARDRAARAARRRRARRSTMRSRPWSRSTRSITMSSFEASRYGKERWRRARRGRVSQLPDVARAVRVVHRCAARGATSITGTSSTRCRTSRDACRSRRWPRAGARRSASVRSSPWGCAIRARAAMRYAVVQLRQEDRAGRMWNLVGFQTRLRIPDQERVFRMIPGLAERGVSPLRIASIAIRTSTRRPRSRPRSRCATTAHVFLAGQITGVEGYTESTRDWACSPESTLRECSSGSSR